MLDLTWSRHCGQAKAVDVDRNTVKIKAAKVVTLRFIELRFDSLGKNKLCAFCHLRRRRWRA